MEEAEDNVEEDFMDTVSDFSSDSTQDNSANKTTKIKFDGNPKNFRSHATKVRQIERRIMLGQLDETDALKLRKSKFFTTRFEKLLNLSKQMKNVNLYRLVTNIYLNEMMLGDLQKKANECNQKIIRQKQLIKISHLKNREKVYQEKINNGTVNQNDINSALMDMYFVVKFGDDLLKLDHNSIYKPEELGKDVLVCDYCQSSAEKNRFGQKEDLLICKDCGNKAHPSCLSYSQELVEQIRADNSWQCIDCKACIVCNGTGEPDTLLFCDSCDKGYHMQCHSPKLEQMPSGKWACSRCSSKSKAVATVSNQQVFVIDDDEEENDKKQENMEVDKSKPTTSISPVQAKGVFSPNKSPLKPSQYLPPQKPTNFMHQIQKPPRPQHGISPLQSGLHMSMPLPMTQPQMIPMGYVMASNNPNQQQQHQLQSQLQPQPLPSSQPQPQPQQQHPPQQTHVLGKGVHNNLNHILNPVAPLPDVRSSIREDVLRALPLDVADWTVKDVAYYFKSHGYVEEGALLQEQEIDGRALLLMSRNDCLTGLRIKLGPALKIYHMHIHKLQMRTEFLG